MDLTPSPRLLQMLGEIEFDEWQCIAELVDNSFDAFLGIKRAGLPWPGGFKVEITLPSSLDTPQEATLTVTDSGPGMSREQLEQAMKAGFSSNDRFTKLGLFGMGFNVSTARLGGLTRVTTTQTDDPFWNSVEIDFETIDNSFNAPEFKEPKDFLSEHGTKIEIGKLKIDRFQFLTKQESNLRSKLGQVYSYLLSKYDFELSVNGIPVKAIRHCVWDQGRSVDLKLETGVQQISAVTNVNKPLTPVNSCQTCGQSQVADNSEACTTCGSVDLILLERKIWGWLGVQRFLSPTDFGIDFLRNGRKILMGDKKLFEWKDPNDPMAAPMVEYPSELAHQGGRIVGEIHIDHVPVVYSKDAFEYSDKGWRFMVDFIRGEGPIRPQKAKALSYAENTSVLATLSRAYAKTAPGEKFLMPGDGTQAIHAMTRDWGKKFQAGDDEYQTDKKWWEAIENHERLIAPVKPSPGDFSPEEPLDGEDDIFREFDQPAEPTIKDPQAPIAEVNDERIQRLSQEPKITVLCVDVNAPSLGQTMAVEAFGVHEGGHLKDTSGNPTAVWLVQGQGNKYKAFLDLDHAVFSSFGFEHHQVLAFEISRHLAIRADKADLAPSSLVGEIIKTSFSGSVATSDAVKSQARELALTIRNLLAVSANPESQKVLTLLTSSDQTNMEDEMILSSGTIIAIQDPAALGYIPLVLLTKAMNSAPELFFDGRVFQAEYVGMGSESAKYLTKVKYAALLTDVILAAVNDSALLAGQLTRTRLSIQQLTEAL